MLELTCPEAVELLVMFELGEDVPLETHFMLPALPLVSMYCQFPEQGLGVVIVTLLTYIVKGAWPRSVYPPAHPTVPSAESASPPSQRPS
jgi:hypothetical protein